MFPNLQTGSLLVPSDSEAFRRQESTFVVFNLILLSLLLLIHTLFSAHFGHPSPNLIYLLAGGFLLLVVELIWLQGRAGALGPRAVKALTWASITLNTGLALALALLTDRQDSPYFVLLVVPVLLAAFRLSLTGTLAVAATCAALASFWVWHFAHYHGPVATTEYFEAGSLSLIFTVVAVLAWALVDNLRRKEQHLRSTAAVLARPSLLSRSTVRPSPRRCWKASCSATSAAPSPVPTAADTGCSKQHTKARCFSMRWRKCPPRRKPSCCAC